MLIDVFGDLRANSPLTGCQHASPCSYLSFGWDRW